MWWLLLACQQPAQHEAVLSPSSGSQTGFYEVAIETELQVSAVTVAGIATYDFAPTDLGYVFSIQGAPTTGAADVALTTPQGQVILEAAFTFSAPEHDIGVLAGIGASLTNGVQGGVPTKHGGLHAPTFQIARQAGIYHPIPLLVEPLFPSIGADDIGPAPECIVPDVASYVASSAIEVIQLINDEDEDRIGFYLAREDPDMTPHNVAVGNTSIADLAYGTESADFALQFLAHLVYDPYGNIEDPVPVGQLDLLDELAPDIIVSTDTFGNDLIGAIVEGSVLDPSLLTPLDAFETSLIVVVERLAASGAEVFLANMPRPTLLPLTDHKIALTLEGGSTQEEVADLLAEIDGMGLAYNDLLDREADRFDNVHVIDLYSTIANMEGQDFQVGGQTLWVGKFGGYLSTDGVHFSDVGYAMVANATMATMNDAMGLNLPMVSLDDEIDDDRHAPDRLRSDGLDIEACE
jgi:hypothetical protein